MTASTQRKFLRGSEKRLSLGRAQWMRRFDGLAFLNIQVSGGLGAGGTRYAGLGRRGWVSAGVFSDGCCDRAWIMAAISPRERRLPRHAIISSDDTAAAPREA